MKVVLIVEDNATLRRLIADALMRAGYGVCETHSHELVPAVPRLDAVVSDATIHHDRFRAPIVPIGPPLDTDDLLARVHRAIALPEERAA
jgi:CheY-like chemotaxis protein